MIPALLIACGGDSSHDPAGNSPAGPAVQATPGAPSGGWFWVQSLEFARPPGEVTLDGSPLDPVWPAKAADLFALYQVPDLDPGPVALDVGGHALAFSVTEAWFEDVTAVVGLGEAHDVSGAEPACSEAQTGVGFADLDLDGDLDAVFGGFSTRTRVVENQGGASLPAFVDRTDAWGLPQVDQVAGVFLADWDNDGDADLFLGRLGTNRVLENRVLPDGVPSWRDVTADSGLGTTNQRTMGAGFGDFDGDGDLDLYEVNHSRCFPDGDPDNDQFSQDHLWRNDGGHVFTEVTGMNPAVLERFGFTALWVDVDRDADQDLWVVNDWTTGSGRSAVWRNDGDDGAGGWSFTDITQTSGIAPATDSTGDLVNAMGGAIGDFNRDGLPDFAFSNIGANQLTVSQGGGLWSPMGEGLGLGRAMLPWGKNSVTWGTHLADLDLDGDLDTVFVGGALKGPDASPHALFENVAGTFIERTWEGGLSSPAHGKASAQLDLDGDGFLDLVVANWGDRPEVWHNLASQRVNHHWLAVDPIGDGVAVNRDGFGAIVELTLADGTVDTCFHNPVPSLGGTSDTACWFGLGTASTVEGVTVIWPDGVSVDATVPAIDLRVEVRR